jgi:cell wall-associated NlpC family hydrolase
MSGLHIFAALVFGCASLQAAPKKKTPAVEVAPTPRDNSGDDAARSRISRNVTLQPNEIIGFENQHRSVQALLVRALSLTQRGLTYRYGSSDPASGGMDCSGTVNYLLKSSGIANVPRDCSGLYRWAQSAGTLHRVSVATLFDPAMSLLRAGDMLFWEGTYGVRRDPPTSHVMFFLGLEKATGAPVMVGSTDGRSYHGERRNGVSVFDFKLPKPGSAARFVGYARVPGL